MIHLNNGVLSKLIIHKIGNSYNHTSCVFSNELVSISTDDYEKIYPTSFSFFENIGEYYSFTHPSDIALNEIYAYCKEIFANNKSFIKLSRDIAKHLYSQTIHPNINTGDLILCLIEDIQIESEVTDAIAIIKYENKSSFFTTYDDKNTYSAELYQGINIRKYEKAALIVNSSVGFKVFSLDKNDSTNYWQRDFLNVEICDSDFHRTKSYLTLTKDFVTNTLPTQFEVNKSEVIDYLNRSVEYFKSTNQFNENEFVSTVFNDKNVIKSFKKHKEEFEANTDSEFVSTFSISADAVKKQSKVFKSVLKLDKNFHIYIHGNNELIEKGYDAKRGKNYYKIYFDEEV